MADGFVLDTSVLLTGRDPPPGRPWATTPEAAAEVSPGGRDAARFARWQAAGLRIIAPSRQAMGQVRSAAQTAGNLERLSAADLSVLALAMDLGDTLLSDDHTVLDVAARLGIRAEGLATEGIRTTMDWKPRCRGCGRWFDGMPRDGACPVCGSPVRPKPDRHRHVRHVAGTRSEPDEHRT